MSPHNPLYRANKSEKLPASAKATTIPWTKRNPIFSFQYTVYGFCISDCNKEQKSAFADTILGMSKRTWTDIMMAGRHKAGSEKIERKSIRVGIPACVTPDVTFFTAVRFWELAPMIGYVNDGVFYVLWLDRERKVYKH